MTSRLGPARNFWNAAWPLLTLAALMWAGNSVVGRAARDDIPPMALAFWRWVAAAIVLAPFAGPHLRRDRAALVKGWAPLLALAVSGLGGFSALLYAGLQTTTALNSVLLQAATPPLILFCSFLIFRERATPAQLAGVLLSMLGVAVIVGEGNLAALARLHLNGGDVLVLIAVALYAVYSSLLRLRPAVHPLSFAFALFAFSAVILIPFYVGELAAGRGINPTPGAWAALAYVVLFPSLVAYLFYNRGVELIGAGRAGQSIHLMPVFGAVLATAFLGESFRPFHAAGVALIAAGIGLASLRRKARLTP